MRSIRRRISIWMLPGLAAVWGLGGFAVYQTYRSALFSSIDSENMSAARLIRQEQRSRGRGAGRANRDPDSSVDDLYYQVWNPDGQTLAKSDNLGETELPLPDAATESIDSQTIVLPSMIRIRTMGMTFGAGHVDGGQGFGSMPMIIVVGRDLSETNSRIGTALVGIAGAGLLMLGGMALLLRMALRNGLQPLDTLAAAASDVNASSLHTRFSSGVEPLELKPIVSHLDSLMERLENGFLRERRFGADLAHELRTPIAEMRTKLDLALKWPEERNDEFFTAAREINGRMQCVVDTMLQLAQLESQGGSFPMELVQLAPIVAETWAPLEELAEEKQIMTEIHCSDDATVQGNPDLWKHILANLLSNSVDYTPEGGSIYLDVNEGGISLSNTVDDFGIEDAGRMFDRFWRADGSRSDSHHSGLGLSLVQACAHDMGFHVSASLENSDGERRLVISVRRKVQNHE